jgi:hypothetical protein
MEWWSTCSVSECSLVGWIRQALGSGGQEDTTVYLARDSTGNIALNPKDYNRPQVDKFTNRGCSCS